MSDLLPFGEPWAGRVLAAVLFVVGLLISGGAWGRRKLRTPRCNACGYSLQGLAFPLERPCPECGRVPRMGVHRLRGRRRWFVAVIGLVLACAVPAYVVQKRVRAFGWRYYLALEPMYSLMPLRTLHEERVGPLTWGTYLDRKNYQGYPDHILMVKQGKKVLYSEELPYFYRESVHAVERGSGLVEIHFKYVPNSWGLHYRLIFQTHGEPFLAWMSCVSPRDGAVPEVEVVDLDGDGVPELVVPDTALSRWSYAAVSVSVPRVVLRLAGERYEPAVDLMRRPVAWDEAMEGRALAQRASLAEQEDQLDISLACDEPVHLIYSGNAAVAWRFVEVAGLELENDFRSAASMRRAVLKNLAASRYVDAIKRLNPDDELIASLGEGKRGEGR